jgi:hypothetical protein
MKKDLDEAIKYLNSMYRESILEFKRQKDKSIKVVIKDENTKYIYSYFIHLDEDFYIKLENILFPIGVFKIVHSDKEENVFRCFDDKDELIWK